MKTLNSLEMDTHQSQFLEIVTLISHSRNNAIKSVNAELINLYWNVGAFISGKLSSAKWGEKTVDELALFIQTNYPEIKGFNKRGLYRMRQFFETYVDMGIATSESSRTQNTDNERIVFAPSMRSQIQSTNIFEKDRLSPTVEARIELSDIRNTILAKLSWTHHRTIFSRCKSNEERLFYIKICLKENYTVRELDRQISASVYERALLSENSVSTVLKDVVPDITQHFKDNYVFEFLNLPEPFTETDLQKGLLKRMKNFLLELGKDFLFIDEEYRLEVGNRDFKADLLFFHRDLQCLVAIELKTTSFEPEHLGKLNFYLEALDRNVRKPHENPSIGILLCKDKDTEVVEYALNRQLSPTMVSQYTLALPDKKILQAKLHELFELWDENIDKTLQ